jgi:hypothetical protein
MKVFYSILTMLLLTACNSSNSTDKLLAEVLYKDQYVRLQMQELTKAVNNDGNAELIDSLIVLSENIERIDKENIAVIDSLLQQGLPKGLSEESYKTIWIVIDHASLEKQVQHLSIIEKMSSEGLIDVDNYAILFDRIAMKQNRPQRYGSQSVQFGTPGNMHLYIWPVENAESLDSLRETVGMGPILKYLEQLTEYLGIDAQYVPLLTVDEINKLRFK